MPEHIRSRFNILPAPIPPTLRRPGRPPKKMEAPWSPTMPAKLENFTSALWGKSDRH
jgi:hypothetical protein